jgi:hypothetical protein
MNTPEVAGLAVFLALALLVFISRQNGKLAERVRHLRGKHRHEASRGKDGESGRTTQIVITFGSSNDIKVNNGE